MGDCQCGGSDDGMGVERKRCNLAFEVEGQWVVGHMGT